jgi:hypothetical protein
MVQGTRYAVWLTKMAIKGSESLNGSTTLTP